MTPRSKKPGKAVVLLSGGLDSATCLAIAGADGYEAHALTVRYGQRHESEIQAAAAVAKAQGARGHDVVAVDLGLFGGSALTGTGNVPKDRSADEMGAGIPVTYVPARNTVMLSLALARAETLGAEAIFIGVNALDYSGYPDCRPAFIDAFSRLANLATKAGVEGDAKEGGAITVLAPLIAMTKAEIVKRGTALGVDYASTLSCYDPLTEGTQVLHCGRCDACQLRKKGFADAGVPDPTDYAA